MTDAEKTILAWCRSGKRGIGLPVMRTDVYLTFKCAVLDMNSSEPVPGGYDWETRSKVLAGGDTWDECLVQLRASKLEHKP